LNLIWPGEAFPSVIANSTLITRGGWCSAPSYA